ncbi:hypothetical protein [Saccharibacillus alkalitolerans]|uniref:Uncharacterized protein n=1 Tax=Saccharibacillus alkalitolerans TaxID=2705290 RepID=A0ABX0F7I3_9BACL|nr:hypothetical protein [Saccharibacillus alkalitolerans]NGZ76921.1 hypothetical protein [Saccharibacillus alkalitolerans]
MKLKLWLGCAFFVFLFGCGSSKPEILDIDAAEVQAIQVGLGMNTGWEKDIGQSPPTQ